MFFRQGTSWRAAYPQLVAGSYRRLESRHSSDHLAREVRLIMAAPTATER